MFNNSNESLLLTLTIEEFIDGCNVIQSIYPQLFTTNYTNNNNSLIQSQSINPNIPYLKSIKIYRTLNQSTAAITVAESESELNSILPIDSDNDESTLSLSTVTAAVTVAVYYQYYIVYNSTYNVPQLLFDAAFIDGTPLEQSEILLPIKQYLSNSTSSDNHSDSSGNNNSINSVNQFSLSADDIEMNLFTRQYHNEFSYPLYTIHPCQTAKLIGFINNQYNTNSDNSNNQSLNLLVSWLSLIGPIVGLYLPINTALTEAINKNSK